VVVGGRSTTALLDTGCELLLVPRKLVSHLELQATEQRVYAANGTEIPVAGHVDVDIEVGRQRTTVRLLVSDDVDELMLGIDWLTATGCHWDFCQRMLLIRGEPVPLLSRKSRILCRRVIAHCDVIVPAGHQANVPLRFMWPNLRTPSGNWLVERNLLRSGMQTAGTLLDDNNVHNAVRVLNMSDRARRIRSGTCLGVAELVDVTGGSHVIVDRWGVRCR
jgi:predicted aspartyl protease